MRISDWSSDVCSSDLRHGGVARPFGAADLFGAPQHLQPVIGVFLTLFDFFPAQFMRANRIAASVFGSRRFVGNRLHSQNMQTAKFGNMFKRSEERREGNEGVVPCKYRGERYT